VSEGPHREKEREEAAAGGAGKQSEAAAAEESAERHGPPIWLGSPSLSSPREREREWRAWARGLSKNPRVSPQQVAKNCWACDGRIFNLWLIDELFLKSSLLQMV
jgi:hypothetical protein